MPKPIDIVGEPGKPPRERGRDHVHLGRRLDHRTHLTRQFTHVSNSRVGDKQEPLDCQSVVTRL
jgi:hypothetical protein